MDANLSDLLMADVNVTSAVEQLGSAEIYLELIDLFYTDGVKRVEQLEELANKQDLPRYVVEAHGLRGAAANIGADKLAKLAAQHEASGKASDITYIEENIGALTGCYRNCLSEIERVLSQHKYGQFAEKERVRRRILAVDDNAVNLAAIERALEEEYEVLPMIAGARAIRYLSRERADLVLLDVQMPDMDGVQTLEEIRRLDNGAKVPVIFLTAADDDAAAAEGTRLGIVDYIIKPFDGADLRKKIAQALEGTIGEAL